MISSCVELPRPSFCNWIALSVMAIVFLGLSGPLEAQQKKKKPKEVIPVPTRTIQATEVREDLYEQAVRSAQRIDELVQKNYEKYNITPNPPAEDGAFVKRVYLDLTGTIPNYKQARMFLTSKHDYKHQFMVDALLSSEGYALHWYNFWADLLRINDRLANNVPGHSYAEWVRQCLEENKPYDQMVYEMLSAEGKIWENPASGYIYRDSGMPLDAVNNTVRIFLGTQIGCAQCHDHPFDKWTQKDFYQMAAFTNGVRTRIGSRDKKFGGKNIVNHMRNEVKKFDEKYDGGGKYNRFLLGNLNDIHDIKRDLKYPHDYAYDDAKPNQKVVAKSIFDPQPKVEKGETPRQAIAKWMTSRENPRFTKTIVNRLWKQCFGMGLIEPVDDMTDDTVSENPELMEFLISEMQRLDFDMKEFLRIICYTQTYQRAATMKEPSLADVYHFPGPILRRMTPEQAWDSFITLAVRNPSNYQKEPASLQGELLNIDLTKITGEELYKRDTELREKTNYKHRKARKEGWDYKGMLLARAAELPQPTPANHFLRQFGQSDRETIQGTSMQGSVPQVLQMFNGILTHLTLHSDSLLVQNILNERGTTKRIDIIFISVLNRYPTEREQSLALREIRRNGDDGYGNVIWSLVNTREFLFLQ